METRSPLWTATSLLQNALKKLSRVSACLFSWVFVHVNAAYLCVPDAGYCSGLTLTGEHIQLAGVDMVQGQDKTQAPY